MKFEYKIKNIKLTNNLMCKRLKSNKITGERLESYQEKVCVGVYSMI